MNCRNEIKRFIIVLLVAMLSHGGPVLGSNDELLLYDPLDSLDTITSNGGSVQGKVMFPAGICVNAADLANAYIQYPYAGKFNPGAGTIQFWVKPNDAGDMGLIQVGTLGFPNSLGIFRFRQYNRTITALEIRKNDSSYLHAWHDKDALRLENGSWYLITAIWQCNRAPADFFQLYINDIPGFRQTGSVCTSLLEPAVKNITLGSTYWYGLGQGQYDEFRIYNYSKSQSEIEADYLRGISPQPTVGIQFTHVPDCGSQEDLEGIVTGGACTDYSAYRVAVYIYFAGWWTKPTFADPLTPIEEGGTWKANITTGGNDPLATKICAYLVPTDIDPNWIRRAGELTLPESLSSYPYVCIERDLASCYKKIKFSGYEWYVKKTTIEPYGPGPNYFSDSNDNVWVDENGYLHLRIARLGDNWECAEVFNVDSLGYGTYVFKIAGGIAAMDPMAVLGLFTYDFDDPNYGHREIDIEFSRWGNPANDNSQYVLQPWENEGNMRRFNIEDGDAYTIHRFRWTKDNIQFQSYFETDSPWLTKDSIIADWVYMGPDNPPPGNEKPRINLWLMDGNPPISAQEIEIVIEEFKFLEYEVDFGDFTIM